jgi:hypothetical protein
LTAVTQSAGDGIQLLGRDTDRFGDVTDLGAGRVSDLLEELRLALTAPRPLAARAASRCAGAPRARAGAPRATAAEAAQRVLYLLALRVKLGEPLFQQFLCLLYGL